MTHYDGISLCTGILGFELSMVIAGLSRHINVRQCVEINPYCQELIRLRLPGVPIWDDLTAYIPPDDLESNRTIIWSGFPCQPVSQAGKQRGDEDKRYLWPHILRLIRQIRPVVWVGENVDGLRTIDSGRIFGAILQGLSESGYCVEWSCVSAAEVGAVHQRERVWFIAYRPGAVAHPKGIRCECGGSNITSPTRTIAAPVGSSAEPADAASQGYQGSIGEGIPGAGWQSQLADRVGDWHQDAQSLFCRSNDGVSANVDGYLLRHGNLDEWLTAATIPTFSRLSSAETRSLSPEDRAEYKRLLAEYHRTKKQYENWLETLGNAICPHQAAVVWQRVGQILGL